MYRKRPLHYKKIDITFVRTEIICLVFSSMVLCVSIITAAKKFLSFDF